MFDVVSKIDYGFEDESFRATYGDHIVDPQTEDIEDRLADQFDAMHNSLECVHDDEPVTMQVSELPKFNFPVVMIEQLSRKPSSRQYGLTVTRDDKQFARPASLKPNREHESRTHSRSKAKRRIEKMTKYTNA